MQSSSWSLVLGITILPDRSFIKVELSLLFSFLVPNMGLMRGALKSSSLKVPNARRGEGGGGGGGRDLKLLG